MKHFLLATAIALPVAASAGGGAPGAQFILIWHLNDDGPVSHDEFMSGAADWLALVERDGSKYPTEVEFGPCG